MFQTILKRHTLELKKAILSNFTNLQSQIAPLLTCSGKKHQKISPLFSYHHHTSCISFKSYGKRNAQNLKI